MKVVTLELKRKRIVEESCQIEVRIPENEEDVDELDMELTELASRDYAEGLDGVEGEKFDFDEDEFLRMYVDREIDFEENDFQWDEEYEDIQDQEWEKR